MGLAGALQVSADLHEKYRVVLPADGVLPLLGSQVREPILQLLGGDEIHVPVDAGVQAGKGNVQRIIGLADGSHNGPHRLAQIALRPILTKDDLFPVPLIHIDGVEVIHHLIPPDGVHVGEEALAGVELIALQSQPLPLGQRVDHLPGGVYVGDIEGDRALHAVEVVIQPRIFFHKQWGGDPPQIQGIAEIHLKIALDKLNGPLHFIDRQRGFVALWDTDLAHCVSTSLF